ncbi:glycosyltransferase [Colwellia sp. MB02u-14]|uniref:glycosyltransferase n=1 Tax=Colwellia sp. MB02u-14 TaxID=2759815 RepID=UPI0015F7506C|nr:glycosyltransferase [Colwellia sp. MB02u-14]MBA6303751.1 glycosyltransferase [Colwellia sp. MB02u-14]
MKTSVSICIATYNGNEFIKEQLDSILLQIRNFDEIVISDDNSTDGTFNILEAYAKKYHQIKLFRNATGKGVICNFENSLINSTNEIVFLCDQDDVWLPGRLLKTIKEFETPEVFIVTSNAYLYERNEFSVAWNKNDLLFDLIGHNSSLVRNLFKNTFVGCCTAFRREVLEIALPFPKNIPMHDVWLSLISLIKGKHIMIIEPMLLYRRHGGNASSTSSKSTRVLNTIIHERFRLLSSLVLRYFGIK